MRPVTSGTWQMFPSKCPATHSTTPVRSGPSIMNQKKGALKDVGRKLGFIGHPVVVPASQALGNGNHLITHLALLLYRQSIKFLLPDRLPVKKLGFIVVNANGNFLFLREQFPKFGVGFSVGFTENVVVLFFN